MSFIKNGWYIAAWANEISDKPLARTIGGDPLVLYRDANGKPAALLDRCCHRGAALSMGEVVSEGLQCGYHGMIFDRAGKCVRIPGQDRIPPSARVRSYILEEKQEVIWIWLGDPAAADTSLIIDYPYHDDHANWPHKLGMLPIDGHYMLLIDNLMDLTHLGFVHRGTIGSGPVQAYVDAIMNTERTPRGVKFTRWFLDHEPPATYTRAVPFKGKVDRWQEFEFVAPGAVIQFTGAVDANTGAYDKGHREGGVALRLLHASTPATENTSYYFFSTANGHRTSEPAATDQLFTESVKTFKEDQIFIERQQAMLSKYPDETLLDIVSDSARVHARRHVDAILAAEAEAAQNIEPRSRLPA